MTTSAPTNDGQPTTNGTNLSTGQRLARYDMKQRAAAKAAGRPQQRAGVPGMILGGQARFLAYLDDSQHVVVRDLAARVSADGSTAPVRLTGSMLHRLVTDVYDSDGGPQHSPLSPMAVGTAVVFADSKALKAVAHFASTMAAKNTATQEDRQVHRVLTYRRGLPTSTFLPVLTDALALRYWLPAGLDADNIDDWSRAFDLTPGDLGTYVDLIGRATDGTFPAKIAKDLVSCERYGTMSAQSGSLTAANSAYTRADSAATAWKAVHDLDPMQRERNMIGGSVAEIRILQDLAGKFTTTVSDPFKFKEGQQVYLFDADTQTHTVSSRILAIEFSEADDRLIATFSQPAAQFRYLTAEAKKAYRPLWVVEQPIIMAPRAVKSRRWSDLRTPNERVKRDDVPGDVMLAGMPTEPGDSGF